MEGSGADDTGAAWAKAGFDSVLTAGAWPSPFAPMPVPACQPSDANTREGALFVAADDDIAGDPLEEVLLKWPVGRDLALPVVP